MKAHRRDGVKTRALLEMEKSNGGAWGRWTVGASPEPGRAGGGAGGGCPGEGRLTTGRGQPAAGSPVKQRADQQLENHLWKGAIAALEGEGQPGAHPRLTGVCLSRAW